MSQITKVLIVSITNITTYFGFFSTNDWFLTKQYFQFLNTEDND